MVIKSKERIYDNAGSRSCILRQYKGRFILGSRILKKELATEVKQCGSS